MDGSSPAIVQRPHATTAIRRLVLFRNILQRPKMGSGTLGDLQLEDSRTRCRSNPITAKSLNRHAGNAINKLSLPLTQFTNQAWNFPVSVVIGTSDIYTDFLPPKLI
jgi:hypothetical protein